MDYNFFIAFSLDHNALIGVENDFNLDGRIPIFLYLEAK